MVSTTKWCKCMLSLPVPNQKFSDNQQAQSCTKFNDDVIKWIHFPRYWSFVRGVTGEFPAQRPVTRNFDVFFDLRFNKRFCKQSWGWWFETTSHPLCHHIKLCISFEVLVDINRSEHVLFTRYFICFKWQLRYRSIHRFLKVVGLSRSYFLDTHMCLCMYFFAFSPKNSVRT